PGPTLFPYTTLFRSERNERPQIRRDHRHLREDHPLRLVAGLNEGLDQLQPLGELLRLQFRGGFRDLLAQIGGHLLEIERLEHLRSEEHTSELQSLTN